MREIKFRAWDNQYKIMCRVYRIEWIRDEMFADCLPHLSSKHTNDNIRRVLAVPQNPIMQYTGLKDKNGKEIYEGDIVRPIIINNTIADGQVCFEDGCFTVVQFTSSGMPNYDCLATRTNFEIIGNIYENPTQPLGE